MSDTLVEQIRAALNAARKDRDNARTLLYSTLLSDLKNRDIELGREVSEAESVEVVRRSIKRRRALMGKVMPQFKGRAEGRVINQIAREELAG